MLILKFIAIFFIFNLRAMASSEDPRFLLPADKWDKIADYQMKGTYFLISLDTETNSKLSLNFYKDTSFSGSPVASMDDYSFKIKFNDKATCQVHRKSMVKKKVSKYAMCTFLSCDEVNTESELNLFTFDSQYRVKIDEKEIEDGPCPVNIPLIFNIDSDLMVNNFFFRFEEFDKNQNYLKIRLNNDVLFADVRFCKTTKNCSVINKSKSLLEHDNDYLSARIQAKDVDELNDLIAYLRPCVIKKDKDCIKKYFLTYDDLDVSKEAEEYLQFSMFKNLKIPELNDETIKELEACLDYKNLLPHLLGTKGIKKVCVFNKLAISKRLPPKGKTFLSALVYPEGVRENKFNNNVIYGEIK